jgi:hypothetical protein
MIIYLLHITCNLIRNKTKIYQQKKQIFKFFYCMKLQHNKYLFKERLKIRVKFILHKMKL